MGAGSFPGWPAPWRSLIPGPQGREPRGSRVCSSALARQRRKLRHRGAEPKLHHPGGGGEVWRGRVALALALCPPSTLSGGGCRAPESMACAHACCGRWEQYEGIQGQMRGGYVCPQWLFGSPAAMWVFCVSHGPSLGMSVCLCVPVT